MDTSEPKEIAIVAVESVLAAVTGFVQQAPLPPEWKLPVQGLTATVATAIFAYWAARVNRPKA